MEILTSYEFKRESRSRYAPVVKALIEDGAPVVRLKRGVDFDRTASMDNVRNSISTQVREAGNGKRARTWTEDDDNLIVTLWGDDEGPRRTRRAAKRPARVAA